MKRSRLPLRSSSGPARRKQQRKLLLEALEGRQMMAADVIIGLGVIGDTYSDEYIAPAYNYADSWVELLSAQGRVDLGQEASFDDYRGQGYAFNWSLNGGTTFDLTFEGAGSNLASQVELGHVSHGVLMLGMEDFSDKPDPMSGDVPYEQIYSGTMNDFEVDMKVDQLSILIGANIDVLGSTGGHFVVSTIPDPGDTPDYRTRYPIAAQRERVTAAIQSVNALIRQRASDNGMPVLDLFAMQKALLGTHTAPIASQTIGGVSFSAAAGGAGAATLFTDDGYHPHTAMQAVIANGVMTALTRGYGEDLQLFTEAQIVSLAGQSGSGSTFSFDYASYVSVPDLTIMLDFGPTDGGASENDFAARIAELWDGNGGTGIGVGGSLTPAEVTKLREDVLAQVQTAFSASAIGENNIRLVDFASVSADLQLNVSKYHHVNLGLETTPEDGRNAIIGHFGEDWRNTELNGGGFIAPEELHDVLTDLTGMDRAARIQYIRNALSFYTVQGIGLSLGLSHADALGRPQITPANYAETGGVQNVDFMSGNEQLGFTVASLKSNVAFSFSPLAKAKLQMGVRAYDNRLTTAAETEAGHGTKETAQPLTLQAVAGSSVKINGVARANISDVGQLDFYSFQAQAGQLITVQTLLSQEAAGSVNTVIRLLDAIGQEIALSDDTALGFNSLNPTDGAVLQSNISLILNFPAPATGTYYIEVTGSGASVGEYDLFVATMPPGGSTSPWTNPNDPLNVDNQPGIVPLDALIIINELNNRLYSDADGRLRPPPVDKPPPYYDVDGDGYLIPLDALIVINYLNRNQGSGEGEGEGASFAADASGDSSSAAPAVDGALTSHDDGDLYTMADWFWQSEADEDEPN